MDTFKSKHKNIFKKERPDCGIWCLTYNIENEEEFRSKEKHGVMKGVSAQNPEEHPNKIHQMTITEKKS
jgi:hypothetical protein